MAIPHDKTPNNKHGGQCKKAYQPIHTTGNHYAMKIWADVFKGRGIHVQIVLGNSNLGTTLAEGKGQRTGGAAWRLGQRNGLGERAVMERGKDSPETTSSEDNKGRKMGKHSGGRVEERAEPSEVASMPAGLLDQMTGDGL
jgi:hypothetical protein